MKPMKPTYAHGFSLPAGSEWISGTPCGETMDEGLLVNLRVPPEAFANFFEEWRPSILQSDRASGDVLMLVAHFAPPRAQRH